ncbi:MAG: mycofactocin biosynthesis peptidyl-dipeptidase MftE [Actinomycetota bacterium]
MVLLGDLAFPEVGERRTLVLPLGSTEQHGAHLPLDTDTVIATTVATRAAARIPAAVVAPALAIGAAGEHAGFAGTLSIGTEVLASAIVEIVRTAGPEFERTVLVNGHGGNVGAIRSAVKTCDFEGRPIRAWSARLDKAAIGFDLHAGRIETSIMLAIAPERVRLGAAEPGVSEGSEGLIRELMERGVKAVSPNGVLGDPTGACADEGARILDEWVDQVAQLLTR